MARQYNNTKSYLEEKGFILQTELQEFKEIKKIAFNCMYDHSTTLTITSFINKKSKTKNNPEKLCTACDKDKNKEETFNKEKEKIKDNCGHILVSLVDRENAVYICGNCEAENKTWLSNLQRNTGTCPKCQNKKFKNKEDNVEERIAKFGVKLISYDDCHNMKVICVCGNEYNTTLPDIERGRLCKNCKIKRTKETNLEKYGVDNVFKSEQIKDKIKKTCFDKYGVEHHLRNKDILEKLKKTNKDKYGVEYVFHTKEAVKKCKETMIEKYGVEYPLQSEFIMAKVRQTFLEKIGYEYPLLCPEIRQKIYSNNMDKYGYRTQFERIVIREKAKKTIMDRYGVDSYFKTQEFISNYPIYWQQARETCLDKYGVEYPMQNPIIYSKCLSSLYRKKEYVFPSGRVDYIMGYEPRVVDELLNKYNENEIILKTIDIPVIEYLRKISNDGKERERNAVYYPDIMLPDTLIEVKSTYTYEKDKENNERKCQACLEQGYNIELWIYSEKKLEEIKIYSIKDGIYSMYP